MVASERMTSSGRRRRAGMPSVRVRVRSASASAQREDARFDGVGGGPGIMPGIWGRRKAGERLSGGVETQHRAGRFSAGFEAAVSIVTVLLAGCVMAGCAPAQEGGPLSIPPDLDITCMPADLYSRTAFGTSLVNSSRQHLKISSVEMINSTGLDLASNSLMPSPRFNLLADAYPPVDQFPDQWPLAEPISDTSVKPYEAHVSLVSEVNLEAGKTAGHFDGLEIYYSNENGDRYVLRAMRALDILTGSCW